MDSQKIYEAITPIFRSALNNSNLVINSTLTSKDVDNWDSLVHIRIIIGIEKFFKIRFSPAEISELPNVGAIVSLIVNKLPKNSF